MTPNTAHEQEYQQAQKAYIQGNYEEAGKLVDRLVQKFPDDPSSRLLKGHVYCVLQRYDVAREQYQTVLSLTQDPEIVDFAHKGLETISQYESYDQSASSAALKKNQIEDPSFSVSRGWSEHLTSQQTESTSRQPAELEDLAMLDNFDPNSLDFSFDYSSTGDEVEDISSNHPFGMPTEMAQSSAEVPPLETLFDPFTTESDRIEHLKGSNNADPFGNMLDYDQLPDTAEPSQSHGRSRTDAEEIDSIHPVTEFERPIQEDSFREDETQARPQWIHEVQALSSEDVTLPQPEWIQGLPKPLEDATSPQPESLHEVQAINSEDVTLPQPELIQERSRLRPVAEDETLLLGRKSEQELSNATDDLEFNQNGFRESDFDLNHPSLAPTREDEHNTLDHDLQWEQAIGESGGVLAATGAIELSHPVADNDLIASTPTATNTVSIPARSPVAGSSASASIASFNAAWQKKQLLTAGAVGAISAVVVAVVGLTSSIATQPSNRGAVRNTSAAMAIVAALASGTATLLLGRNTARQIQRTAVDLKNQFDSVRAGNLNAKATIYAEDEFSFLPSGFNDMAKVMFTNIKEAQRKAEEQERAKDDLQRQVIRLLDDVEGAARGDLTVQATVSADVLGAVADSFNLTIYNLRGIVQQVKTAARQVSKGAIESETFARALSSDALRQAEELAVTLNSVQVMTDAIQRVAESAREAESVARSASATAKKGGEAVERTVAGILEIRQTVAQTTRKVKRLAESSQEISKIVALISQIASRTNLLALNASIEAARAGESGRGFAIVADEVRQLADRVAKALTEIEQIVRQIQSETGSVMTAMEEGTQQVIQGTHLAEQAKRSLDDIVQVSHRIDTLVRSITADTVEQTETSRAVAAVMQSVELTAQETSQEAQHVSGSLQSLARVAGDLLNSVDRFRIETTESR